VDLTIIFYGAATLLGIYGAVLNSRCNIRGLYIWIGSNIFFILYGLLSQNYPVTFIFLLYLAISAYGIIQWSNKRRGGYHD